MRIPFFLLAAHARRTWLRTVLTVGSVFIAVLIFGFLRTFIVSLDSITATQSSSRVVTGSALSLFAHLPRRIEPELQQVPGVIGLTHWTWFGGIYVDESPEHNTWGRFGVDVPQMRKVYGSDMKLSDEAWDVFESQRTACIIGADLAADEKLEVGSTLPILGNIFPGTIELEVVGIYESVVKSFDQKTLFFHWDYMNEVSKKNGGRSDIVSTYTLLLDDPSRAGAVCAAIDAEYESSDNRTTTLTERAFSAQFVTMWGNVPFFFTVLGTVVMIACLMVTTNTMLLNARERVQEVGVLKTLGFSPASVAVMTLVEGILLCLVAGALALPIIGMLDGARLQFLLAFVPPSTYVEGALIALGLGVISGAAPAIVASRMDIVEALRRRA